MGVPQAEDAPRVEEAALDVVVATAAEAKIDSDGEWTMADVPKEDYGLKEDYAGTTSGLCGLRCRRDTMWHWRL